MWKRPKLDLLREPIEQTLTGSQFKMLTEVAFTLGGVSINGEFGNGYVAIGIATPTAP